MKRLLWLALIAAPLFSQPATTTVTDTLYTGVGPQYCTGTITLSWQDFYSKDGYLIKAGKTSVNVNSMGVFTLNAVPTNTNQAPAAGLYSVQWNLTPPNCIPAIEAWNVPSSNTPVDLNQVRTLPTPPPSLIPPASIQPPISGSNQTLCFLNGIVQWGSDCGASAGTVTSVGLSLPAIFDVSGSPVTSSGTLTAALAAQYPNLVWAGPATGSPAAPTFRGLTLADLPSGLGTVTNFSAGGLSPLFTTSVNTSTTTPALSFTASNAGQSTFLAGPSSGGSGAYSFRSIVGADLPDPSATTLGGVESLAATSHQWINEISTSGVPSSTQPACGDLSNASGGCEMSTTASGDLSGTLPSPSVTNGSHITNASIPNSGLVNDSMTINGTPCTLGGSCSPSSGSVTSVGLALPSIFSVSGSPVTGAGTLTGAFNTEPANEVLAGPSSGSAATPGFRALVGADLPTPGLTTLGGVFSTIATSHQWLTYIDTTGTSHQSQPSFSDLSSSAACGQLPALTGFVISSGCATSVASSTGSGAVVEQTSPTITTPDIAMIYGGSSAGSTITVEGTSNGSPSAAYVYVNPNGMFTQIGSAIAPTSLLTLNQSGSASAAGLPSPYVAGNVVQLIGSVGNYTALDVDTYAGSTANVTSQQVFRTACGTPASPSANTTSCGNYLGVFNFYGYNGAAFANGGNFAFYPTGTWSTSSYPTEFVLNIVASGSTSLSQAMTVTATTLSLPTVPSSTAALTGALCWNTGGAVTFDATKTCTASSRRFKHSVRSLGTAASLALIDQLHPVKFRYNSTNEQHSGGLVAEEVAKLDPHLVSLDKDGKPEGVMYIDMIPILIAAVQEQQKEIESLRRELRR